ncbi:putative SANT/Myb domain, leucine-rich repeat domain superfamily [Septoria linicola]|nr:putative SANT/Myb domain, leucine-rich repeat domain superfamily [Septoria linicola]
MTLPSSPPLLPQSSFGDVPSSPPLLPTTSSSSSLPWITATRKRQLSEYDSHLSSDPLFSDDTPGNEDATEYQRPKRKRMIKGPWWELGRKVPHDPTTPKQKDYARNVDSGVWMGSDGSEGSFEGIPLHQDRLSRLNLHDRPRSVQTPRAAAQRPTPQAMAAEIVNRCVEDGVQRVDLSELGLVELPSAILKPLHELIRQPAFDASLPPSDDEFGPLTPDLQLFLATNGLISLPDELFRLHNITVLSLRNNALTELPSAINHLARLKELNVANNTIRHLPWELLDIIASRQTRVIVHPNPLLEPLVGSVETAPSPLVAQSYDRTVQGENHTADPQTRTEALRQRCAADGSLDMRTELELRLQLGHALCRQHIQRTQADMLPNKGREELIYLASSAVQFNDLDGLPSQSCTIFDGFLAQADDGRTADASLLTRAPTYITTRNGSGSHLPRFTGDMKFSVHVMPPPPKQRPPDLRAGSTPAPMSSSPLMVSSAHPRSELKTLAVPIDPEFTFADLWKETEKRFRRAFDKDKIAGMQFSHLMDSEGGYITVGDTVGSMYREDAPPLERQLWMYMKEIDREDTIPAGSDLRPKEFQKRRWTDMDDAEQATVKRRRAEEQRYGAPIDELDPDTPVVSREAGNEGRPAVGMNARPQQKESVRVDADGFKIPARPTKLQHKPPARTAQQSPIVLVNSSQLEEDDASKEPPTPDSTDRRSGGETPPSAQLPPPPQPEDIDVAASPETPPRNAFQVLGRNKSTGISKSAGKSKSGGESAYTRWTDDEDQVIFEGMRRGWDSSFIAKRLPGQSRSGNAIRNRKMLLKAKRAVEAAENEEPGQGSQVLEFASSPPVASGSTGPQSSPCETAKRAKSPVGPIAYVQLTQPPAPVEPSFLESSPAESMTEQVHGQTATPPTSNASETSGGKLRAPAAGPTNASRLRKARTRVKPPFVAVRQPEPEPQPASIATGTIPESGKETENDSHRGLGESTANIAKEATIAPEIPNLSVASEHIENRLDTSNTTDDQVDTPAKDDVPIVLAISGVDIPAQPTPEITLPTRKKNSIYSNRTDKERWNEALQLAKGDKIRAKEVFIVNLNKEDMLNAVTAEDQPEIERLKAQRRRRERELAISKGLPVPKRRVPTSFSSGISSKPDLYDADEEVVREDDWTTDEEEARQQTREEEHEEEIFNEDAIHSDHEDDLLDVEAQLDGPRVAELADSPPPSAAATSTKQQVEEISKHVAPLTESQLAEFELSSSPAVAFSETSSNAERRKRRQPRRRKSRLSDATTYERPDDLRRVTSISDVASEALELPVLQKTQPAVAGCGNGDGRRPSHSSVASAVPKLSPLQEEAPCTTTPMRQANSKASLPHSPRNGLMTPAKPALQRKASTPFSKHSHPGKKKLVDTPKMKLTREEAVAAHLAECKRKEALYLNNDDDDDDDSSASSSS